MRADENTPGAAYVPPASLCPVTRLERLGRFLGFLLLAMGMIVLYLAADSQNNEPDMVDGAVVSLMIGAGLTAFCFIFHAVRRW
jgi:hypothetical protein